MVKISVFKKYVLVYKTINNLITFIGDYLNLIKGEKIYYLRKIPYSIIARAGTNDCKEIVVVMSGYEYPLKKLPIIHSPVILDIGAHIGCFALYALDYYKNIKILCIEPAQDNFQLLKRNLEINNIEERKYSLCNCAVGSFNGQAKLNKAANTDAYYISEDCLENYEICNIFTLDTICKTFGIEKVDILKLDIEGGEYDLLNNEENIAFLNNNVSYIMMEYHVNDQYKNIEWIMKCLENNFSIVNEKNRTMILKNIS